MFADALVVLYEAFLSSVKFKASIIKWKNIDTSLSDMEAFPMHYVIMCNFYWVLSFALFECTVQS